MVDKLSEIDPVLLEFEDVSYTPLSVDSSSDAVLVIHYPLRFAHTFGLLRTVTNPNLNEKLECSDRMLNLLKSCALLNPADYSVWHFRSIILSSSLFKDRFQNWLNERQFLDTMIKEYPKNYQLWQHRRFVCTHFHQNSTENSYIEHEKSLIEDVLRDDSKNYHAWSHRDWFVQMTGSFEGEIVFCERMIESDSWNNSAWNYRFELRQNAMKSSLVVCWREWEWAWNIIEQIGSNNESVWNYVKSVSTLAQINHNSTELWSEIINRNQSLTAQNHNSIWYLSAILDAYVTLNQNPQKCTEICSKLAESDPIRKLYWLSLAPKA